MMKIFWKQNNCSRKLGRNTDSFIRFSSSLRQFNESSLQLEKFKDEN